MHAKAARQVIEKASKIVTAMTLFPASAEGSIPLAVHTGDNLDFSGDHHYLLTTLIMLGMTLSKTEAEQFASGFGDNLPKLDVKKDLDGINMTEKDLEMVDQWTTIVRALKTARALREHHALNNQSTNCMNGHTVNFKPGQEVSFRREIRKVALLMFGTGPLPKQRFFLIRRRGSIGCQTQTGSIQIYIAKKEKQNTSFTQTDTTRRNANLPWVVMRPRVGHHQRQRRCRFGRRIHACPCSRPVARPMCVSHLQPH